MNLLEYEQDVRKQIKEAPMNWELRLILADILEERGEDVLARGQRWQSNHKKRPWSYQVDSYKIWYNIDTVNKELDPNSDIPQKVFNKLTSTHVNNMNQYSSSYDTIEEAECDLANALNLAGV
jgi:hypothetical protein